VVDEVNSVEAAVRSNAIEVIGGRGGHKDVASVNELLDEGVIVT